jgi:hypothetical protein
VDYAVGAENVDSHQTTVEIDRGAFESYADCETLCVAEVVWVAGLIKCGDCVGVEDSGGGIEVRGYVVEEDFFDVFFGGLVAVVRDLFEG